MIFPLLSVVALFLGLLFVFNKKRSLISFAFLLALIPTGNAYYGVIAREGIFFYDFYVFGLFLSLSLSFLLKGTVRIRVGFFWAIFITLSVPYVLLAFYEVGLDKYFLKEARFYITIVTFAMVCYATKSAGDFLTEKNLIILVLAFCAFNFVDYYILSSGIYLVGDEFYEKNTYRYLDAGTYVAAIYTIYYVYARKDGRINGWLALLAFIMALAAVLLSNSRFIMASLLVSFIPFVYKKPKLLFAYLFSVAAITTLFLQVSSMVGSDRVMESLSADGVINQAVGRFFPAIERINQMSFFEYIFGYGFGTTFEIPWFDYRGLETQSINIDSSYLTLYVKYGVVSFVFIFAYIKAFMHDFSSLYRKSVVIFILVLSIVSALPYQAYTIGIALAYCYFESFGNRRRGRKL